jgi:hypothetical protein
MSSTTKGILFGLAIALALAAAASAQEAVEFQQLVRKAPFIFYGTVRKTGAANLDAVPASPSNAVVRVDRVLSAPPAIGNFTGRDITVSLLKAESPKNGERAVFFTTGWIYGKTLAVREVSHLADPDADVKAIGARLSEAQRLNREEDLAALLARAEVVVLGTVIRIEPADREKTRLPLTEHDPELARAFVRVETVLKGKLPAEGIVSFLVARSRDVMWERSPKPKEGQTAIWILARDEKKGLKLEAITAFDPRDVQPPSSLDLIRKLLGTQR